MVFRSGVSKNEAARHMSLTIGEIEPLYFAGACGCGKVLGYSTVPEGIIIEWGKHRQVMAGDDRENRPRISQA